MQKGLLVYQLLLALVRTSCASNGTLTENVKQWVADEDQRSTSQIFFSCSFTLFACTWSVLHLNVPKASEGEIKILIRKLKWMLIAFVGPEFVFGHAMAEFTAAWKSRRYMKSLAAANDSKWTLSHGFYANQGGFVLKPQIDEQSTTTLGKKKVSDDLGSSMVNGINSERTETSPSIDLSSLNSTPVNANQIRYLAQEGLITFPTITEDEIDDKSKSDIFAKAVACWQVLWLLIQCIAREARKLPTTPLEISTLSFSACTLATYGLWLKKPLDVKIPTQVSISYLSDVTLAELKALSTKSIVADFFLVDQLGRGRETPFHPRTFNDSYFVDRTYIIRFPRDVFVMVDWEFGVTMLSILFGGLHLIAWNFGFPTAKEQLLWRIASAFSAGVMPLLYALGTVVTTVALKIAPDWAFKHKDQIFSIPIVLCSLSYAACRLYLLGESFASLRSLPQQVFQGTWSTNLPGIN